MDEIKIADERRSGLPQYIHTCLSHKRREHEASSEYGFEDKRYIYIFMSGIGLCSIPRSSMPAPQIFAGSVSNG